MMFDSSRMQAADAWDIRLSQRRFRPATRLSWSPDRLNRLLRKAAKSIASKRLTNCGKVVWNLFPLCDGVIATAAVCDYRPRARITGKITKTGQPMVLELVETSDVLAELGSQKEHRWIVGFALESQDPRNNAMRKLRMKNCDCIVLNDTVCHWFADEFR